MRIRRELVITTAPLTGSKANKPIKITVLPDTGATLCVTGLHMLNILGLKRGDLVQSSRRIVTATGGNISCLGWAAVVLSVDGRTSEQKLYVCSNIRRTYLSKSGCIALGVIHKEFPRPLFRNSLESFKSPTLPVRPTKLPYTPKPENIPLFKNYLLKVFSKSAP